MNCPQDEGCTSVFTTQAALDEHRRTVQSRTCNVCRREFLNSQARDQHFNACHRFKCQVNDSLIFLMILYPWPYFVRRMKWNVEHPLIIGIISLILNKIHSLLSTGWRLRLRCCLHNSNSSGRAPETSMVSHLRGVWQSVCALPRQGAALRCVPPVLVRLWLRPRLQGWIV